MSTVGPKEHSFLGVGFLPTVGTASSLEQAWAWIRFVLKLSVFSPAKGSSISEGFVEKGSLYRALEHVPGGLSIHG